MLALNIPKDGNSMCSPFLLITDRALCSVSSDLALCCVSKSLFEQAAVDLSMTFVPWTLSCVRAGQSAGPRPLSVLSALSCSVPGMSSTESELCQVIS